MLTSYLKIAFRNLTRNSVYSIINIGGLSIGMAAVMSIGLWIYDELAYNQNHNNYDRIAMVMQNNTNEGYIETQSSVPMPLANELRSNHEGDFKYVVMTSGTIGMGVNYGDKNLMATGNYFEADAPRMFTFKMVKGTS